MFLYVVATKVVTDFNDNDKRLKVYRQETINIVNFADENNFF